jgi:hypothetical protein
MAFSDHGVRRIEHSEFTLCLGPAALGRDRDFDFIALDQFHVDYGGGVVFSVDSFAGGISLQRSTKLVVGVEISATHAFIHHLLQVQNRLARRGLEVDVHADFDKRIHDARVLADGPVALGTHAAVDEDLSHGVFRGRRLFLLVRLGEARNVVDRVVVADVLQRARNAGDEIFLADDGH